MNRNPLNLRISAKRANELFERLQKESGMGTYVSAALEKNRKLNRYPNVWPFDSTRVVLNQDDTTLTTDYINASHVRCVEANRAYILTQGPLYETVDHFWTMVWQQKSSAIIMLCKTVEKGICKCYHYWPGSTSRDPGTRTEPLTIEDSNLEVELIDVKEDVESDAKIRTMNISHLSTDEARTVTQYHFQTWPDFGVPEESEHFLSFVKRIGRENPATYRSPSVVHCSAGIGRSGTFCLVDSCLKRMSLEKQPLDQDEVFKMLLNMRSQRIGLIQTPDQLQFAFSALSDAMSKMDFEKGFFEEESVPLSNKLLGVPGDKTSSRPTSPKDMKLTNGTNGVDSNETEPKTKDSCKCTKGENGVIHVASAKSSTENISGSNPDLKSPTHQGLSRKRSTDFGSEAIPSLTNNPKPEEMAEPIEEVTKNAEASTGLDPGAKRKRDC